MHCNVRLRCDVGARVDWNRQPISFFFVVVVEVEFSHLKPKVAKASRRLQPALHEALLPRLRAHALVDVFLAWELLSEPVAFTLSVRCECLGEALLVENVVVFGKLFADQDGFRVAAVGYVELVIANKNH